ncbi:MAG TPA: hypothetical protein PLH94_13200 [Fimbriimonadaceae bacterium]|nr:hypothetical protein [Fimbriimonadaceae bacterium]
MVEGERHDLVEAQMRRFAWRLGLALAFVAALPALIGWLVTPPGGRYLGFQINVDDHMVYAAWMRQAVEGRIFFDNRFTTDAQPGLTLHLYFLVLGWISKILGPAITVTLARIGFTYLFVVLANRLILELRWKLFVSKLALFVVCVGGGFGFMLWQTFGVAVSQPALNPIEGFVAALTHRGLPTDVWQPEGFVFPSMLTNSLFMVSLCLIALTLLAILRCREGWRPVLWGAVAFGVLMNIHSYDVLLVAIVCVGLLAATLASKAETPEGETTIAPSQWAIRVAIIGLGALPAALWFVYVLRNDPVFQARAATLTFTPSFRQIAIGYLPLILLGIVGFLAEARTLRERIGVGILVVGLAVMYALAPPSKDAFWMGAPAWGAALVVGLVVIVLLARPKPAENLVISWAVLGVVAPYIPGLFQRKLLMGLAIPWAILAAAGLWVILRSLERSSRNLVAALAILILAGTSLRWFTREIQLQRTNVSNTTVHPVMLDSDAVAIIRALSNTPKRTVVVAIPGVASPTDDPDVFRSPIIPDLNPILSGLTGVYTYAGHWSETPDYGKRRAEATRLFFDNGATDEQRMAFLRGIGAEYVIAPQPSAFPDAGLADLRPLGTVVVSGTKFDLIQLLP